MVDIEVDRGMIGDMIRVGVMGRVRVRVIGMVGVWPLDSAIEIGTGIGIRIVIEQRRWRKSRSTRKGERERRRKINSPDCLFEVPVVGVEVEVISVRYHAEKMIELPSVANDDYDFYANEITMNNIIITYV
jgi:hypothetical protein